MQTLKNNLRIIIIIAMPQNDIQKGKGSFCNQWEKCAFIAVLTNLTKDVMFWGFIFVKFTPLKCCLLSNYSNVLVCVLFLQVLV